MSTTISIARRFSGPKDYGNGGYAAGLIAAQLREPVTVRLLRPLPLETDLTVEAVEGGYQISAGEQSVAIATPREAPLELVPPPAPSLEEARAISQRHPGWSSPRFTGCFVCGVARAEGDGMRIFAGTLPSAPDRATGPWTPDATLAPGARRVPDEFVWAALDCPGYFAAFGDGSFALLGELSARIEHPIEVGEPLVVLGWTLERRGRKRRAGTALFDASGNRRALAEATWIQVEGAS